MENQQQPANKIWRTNLDKMREFPDGTPAPGIPSREYTPDEWEAAVKNMEMKTRAGWPPPIIISELYKKEFPEQKWVVRNMFASCTINQLSAPPNQWKTWLACYIAIKIAEGKQVFGRFDTTQQGVLIVNEEDTEELLQERIKMLLSQPEDLPVYVHANKGIKLTKETTNALIKEMKDRKLTFIIFDSLSVIHTAEENSAKEMGAIFELMKQFTRTGVTVLFTNHHRKKSRDKWQSDDPQEQTRGSSVINAVPSAHMTCEEQQLGSIKYLIIKQPKLKSAKKLTPFQVRVVEDDGKISFIYDGEHEESADAATKLRDHIYKIIKESDEWFGVKELVEMTGKSEKSVRTQVRTLRDEKQIKRESRASLAKRGAKIPKRDKSSGQEYLYSKIDIDDEASLAMY